METNARMWLLGQFISIGIGVNIWAAYGFGTALAVSYGLSVLVDIRRSVAEAEK